MKASIVISSYNYEAYIADCIESALSQSHADIELIIVDDGSTDGTRELLADQFASNDRLTIVEKENGGQLSVFNTAMGSISGDIVFFLDSDDLYEPGYVAQCVDFYEQNPDCDFIFANTKLMGEQRDLLQHEPIETRDFGFSMMRAYYLRSWLGAPTSAVSMRMEVLRKILPLDLEPEWKIRADDCLVWGASLVGARKYSFAGASIYYRVHDSNSHYGKHYNMDYRYRRTLEIYRLFDAILEKNDLQKHPDLIMLEYKSIRSRRLRDFIDYSKIIMLQNSNVLVALKRLVQLARVSFSKGH